MKLSLKNVMSKGVVFRLNKTLVDMFNIMDCMGAFDNVKENGFCGDISFVLCGNESSLHKQMSMNGCVYFDATKNRSKLFGDKEVSFDKDVLDIKCIYESLTNVTTDYVMVACDTDSVVGDVSEILKAFEGYKCGALFSSKPKEDGIMSYSILEKDCDFMVDSSFCLGKTNVVLDLYKKLSDVLDVFNIEHYMDRYEYGLVNRGMNGFIRKFIDDLNHKVDGHDLITFDYRQNIFKL